MPSPFTPLKVTQEAKTIPWVTLASDFQMVFVKQNVQSRVMSCTSCAGRQEDDSSKKWWCTVSALSISLLWGKIMYCSDHRNEVLAWGMCSRVVDQVLAVHGQWCGAKPLAGEETFALSPVSPACLASAWVGVKKDLKGVWKRPPRAITLNLSFQVLAINMVPWAIQLAPSSQAHRDLR